MTGMDDLATFLRAQLDEDERVARAADSGRWLPEDKGITFEYRADDFHGGEAQARLVADTRANQWHIANWDPARVLAEVDAKRRMLELHAPVASGSYIQPGPLQCEHCADQCHSRSGLGCDSPDAPWPCDTVRLLALPYADRPGYQEEWRP